MFQYCLHFVLNILSFYAVSVVPLDEKAWLISLFLFSASILLEGYSLVSDPDIKYSWVVKSAVGVLLALSLSWGLISILGISDLIEFTFGGNDYARSVLIRTAKNSLAHSPRKDITVLFKLYGYSIHLVPICLFLRKCIISLIRRTYNLERGFFGK